MRIVFIGTVEFSRRVLERLLALHAEIVGGCTLRNSKFNADHVDLSALSASHGIPWFYAEDINSVEVLSWIQDKSPDVIFCFGWSRLLKSALAEIGAFGRCWFPHCSTARQPRSTSTNLGIGFGT